MFLRTCNYHPVSEVQYVKIKPQVCKTHGSRSRYRFILITWLVCTVIQKLIVLSITICSLVLRCQFTYINCFIFFDPAICKHFLGLWTKTVCQIYIPRMYQRNITTYSHVGSLHMSWLMEKSVYYFYRHIILGNDFMHCTGYSLYWKQTGKWRNQM